MAYIENFKFTVNTGEQQYEATRYNTSAFLHLGSLAMYDHVFMLLSPDEALYVFRHNEQFPTILATMKEQQFPAHVNLTKVPEVDLVAFEQSMAEMTTDSDGFVPDNWA